jgi:hypothetical protein
MIKKTDGIRASLVLPDFLKGKTGDLNVIGCIDKVDVEHIRNGQRIYSSEEK